MKTLAWALQFPFLKAGARLRVTPVRPAPSDHPEEPR